MTRDPKLQPRDAPAPVTSEFVQSLLGDLTAGSFGRAAWRRFFARAWQRAWERIRQRPARVRSYACWAGAGALGGAALLVATALIAPNSGWRLAATVWIPWYLWVGFWTLLHLGLVESREGVAHERFLVANGLSFLRMAWAPLVARPALSPAVEPGSVLAWVLIGFVALLVASDLFDGLLARSWSATSRLGGVLDHAADVVFLSALAAGLWSRGMLPGPVLALLLLRYPGTAVGVAVVFFVRGPVAIRPTLLGKATSALTSIVLIAATLAVLVRPGWLPLEHVRLAVLLLCVPLGGNVAYLIYRSFATKRTGDGDA